MGASRRRPPYRPAPLAPKSRFPGGFGGENRPRDLLQRAAANVAAHADAENRRIIDRAFLAANAQPSPKLETNSITNLFASVRSMGLCSIMPEYFQNVLGLMPGIKAVPLAEPAVEHSVGLVAMTREPQSPLITALFAAARKLDRAEHK